MFVNADIIKSNGPKSLKHYTIHAFSHTAPGIKRIDNKKVEKTFVQ